MADQTNQSDDDRERRGGKQSGTDKPWERPGQAAQNPGPPPSKPDLERWQETNTH